MCQTFSIWFCDNREIELGLFCEWARGYSKRWMDLKIIKITNEKIIFDNGSYITYEHYQDWCENNWADFDQIDDLAKEYDYEENLKFESVEGAGFRFGDSSFMVFVPCYSEQNGYYSSDIDIFYNKKKVLNFCCEEILY